MITMKHIETDKVKLRLGDMLFTWDDAKERINIRKHKIDFKTAASIFIDSYLYIESNSVDEYTGEERFDAIGMIAGDRAIFVVYVDRITIDGDDIRYNQDNFSQTCGTKGENTLC